MGWRGAYWGRSGEGPEGLRGVEINPCRGSEKTLAGGPGRGTPLKLRGGTWGEGAEAKWPPTEPGTCRDCSTVAWSSG